MPAKQVQNEQSCEKWTCWKSGAKLHRMYSQVLFQSGTQETFVGYAQDWWLDRKLLVHIVWKNSDRQSQSYQTWTRKAWKTLVYLSHHIRNMHEKYPCDLCGKMIATKHKSRHFQQVHVDPEHRRYKCEHCGKGFAASQSLKDHVNLHTGERPHVCKFCGKSFADYGIRPTYC